MSKHHIPFRIRRSKDGQWYFVIIAKNGKILATSETYKRKNNCLKGIISVDGNISDRAMEQDFYIDETINLKRVLGD